MQRSPIQWTDFTSNPIKYRDPDGKVVWGCVKVSAGCAYCYAEATAERFDRGGPFTVGKMATLTPFVDDAELKALLSPRRLPAGSKVFIGDMTDIFGPWVTDEMLDRVFAVMALRRDVVFQLLTKRPERMREYLTWTHPSGSDRAEAIGYAVMTLADDLSVSSGGIATSLINGGPCSRMKAAGIEGAAWPLPNVWCGTSVEDQAAADTRIPELLATPAAVRFLSCEPLLGPVGLRLLERVSACNCANNGDVPSAHERMCGWERGEHWGIDWVIVGGESGAKARPCDIAWIRSIVAQCAEAGVACFVKQLGAHVIDRHTTCADNHELAEIWPSETRIDDKDWHRIRLRDRHGGAIDEWPPDLRVREFPEARANG